MRAPSRTPIAKIVCVVTLRPKCRLVGARYTLLRLEFGRASFRLRVQGSVDFGD